MKKSKKILTCLVAVFGMMLAACGKTSGNGKSSVISINDSSSDTVVPSSEPSGTTSVTPPPSSQPSSQSSIEEPHFCTHVCPICGGCLDPNCTDPVCARKCPGHEVIPEVSLSSGSFLLEAEDGKISGTMTGTDPNDAFVGERASDNPDHATSGGKVVFCWAAAGNTVTLKFKLDAAEENAQIKLWVSCGASQVSSGLGFSVNGEAKSWKESTVEGKGFSENKWYYWNALTTAADLVAGNNVFVITNVSGESWNLDCIEVSRYVAPTHVCQHVCPECGKCTDPDCSDPVCADKCQGHKPIPNVSLSTGSFLLEAEDGKIEGAMTSTEPNDQFVNERASDNPDHPTSGGKVIINWAAANNKVTLKFNLDAAETNAQIKLWVTCAFTQQSSGLGFSVNGEAKAWNESAVNGKGSEGKWYYWNALTTAADLVAGENVFVITNLSGESWNLDCIEVSKYVEPPHVCQHVCPICGKCTDPDCTDPVCAEKCEGHSVSMVDFILEAEDGKIEGTMTSSDPSDSFIGERASDNPDHATSGGKVVFNWAAANNTVTWKFSSDTAMENAQITLWATCAGSQNSSGLNIKVNNESKSWNESTVEGKGFSENKWYYWNAITTSAPIIDGENTIVITNASGESWNLDCLVISIPESAHLAPIVSMANFIFEAEDGKISGTMTSTDPNDAFVGERASDNPDHATSGGKVVFNWAAANNTVAWTINSDADVEDAQLTLWATCAGSQASSGLGLKVNGESSSWNEGTVDGRGFSENKWYYWNALTTTADLVNGENTIVLTNASGESWNLDCLVIAVPESVTLEKPEPVQYLEFTNGVARLELEEGALTNCNVTDPVDGESLSGGHGVGSDFAYGSEVSLTFNLKEAKTLDVIVCYACGLNQNDNAAFELYVNGSKMGNYGALSDWHDWQIARIQNVELQAGQNIIKLAGPYGSYTNLDYLELVEVLDLSSNAKLEAENGVLSGGCSVFNQNETETLSNGQGVGDFNYGKEISHTFNLREAKTVKIVVRYACGLIQNDNAAFELHVNGNKLGNYGVLTDWHDWTTITIENVKLQAGQNIIKLAGPYGSYTNIDYLEIVVSE